MFKRPSYGYLRLGAAVLLASLVEAYFGTAQHTTFVTGHPISKNCSIASLLSAGQTNAVHLLPTLHKCKKDG